MSPMTHAKGFTVELGDRAYPVHIAPDALAQAGQLIAPLLSRKKTAIISDNNVAPLYGKCLQDALARENIAAELISIKPGETSKDFATLSHIIEQLLAAQIERDDVIIALGGGVVGDLTGFAASILRRGCRFIQIPTSLLAQVDSSVGGKTGINSPQGKNLIGSFYQPQMVIIDPNLLTTLPPRHLRAGYGEIVKMALIGDRDFFHWLEEQGSDILALEPNAVSHAIETACKAKAAIIAQDEHERGQRALLNLGHSFGHGLEMVNGYGDNLFHGEAVALGCAMAFRFSAARGDCPSSEAERVSLHFAQQGLPAHLSDIDFTPTAEALLAAMEQDKKVSDGNINLILARSIGDGFIAPDIDRAILNEFLATECIS